MMNDSKEYTDHVLIKCRARATLYHSNARKWSRAHWITGIVNSLIGATISILSFLAQQQGWNNTVVGAIGGLVLSVSSSIITALKTGQNQTANEQAGDAYRNLEEKVFADFHTNPDELVDRYQQKLEKLTNRFPEPDPKKCIAIEEELYKQMAKVREIRVNSMQQSSEDSEV